MKFTVEWLKAALIRAIRTAAQVALGMITVGMTVKEVDWLNILSVSLVAALYSLLTSVVTDLPELDGGNLDGTLMIDTHDETVDKYLFNIDQTKLEDLAKKSVIKLKVDPEATLSNDYEGQH